ncbi:chemerin-like receptor 1 isoform X1 [Petaurus breviceps papuanus]|uniref:chemerin-like receptor 1 isoform X1 n=2 Tax=Petaurus breviceps papuanus TaxID=3040969 RepID=UPI0036DC9BF1
MNGWMELQMKGHRRLESWLEKRMATDDYYNFTDGYYDYEGDGFVIAPEESTPNDDGVARIFLVVVYSLVCFLGLLGNGLVIVITAFKMKKTVNTVWFLNLAVADFLFNVFLPIHIVNTAMDYHWVFGKVMCKISHFVVVYNMYTSVFLLTTISFDRCVSVVFPVWSQNHRSIRLASIACAAIWTLAFFLGSPSLVFRDTTMHQGKTFCFNNFSLLANVSHPYHSHLAQDSVAYMRHVMVTVTRFLCGFILPVFIITVCYLIIVCKLKRNRLAKSKKPFKIIVTIIITFFLCWCPYHTLYLLELHHTSVPASVFSLGLPLATALAISNSCMNPILYVFMGQDFKKFKVTIFSRLVNALSEDTTAHSSFMSHRSITKMSSVNERSSMNERETGML